MGNLVHIRCIDVFSHYFPATNGVKQGGVVNPILFCVYIDDTLQPLTASGVWCYMGSIFVGALVYADDIVLVAPLATAVRKLLGICDEYVDEYHIIFN